jgi:hypothetical protein
MLIAMLNVNLTRKKDLIFRIPITSLFPIVNNEQCDTFPVKED